MTPPTYAFGCGAVIVSRHRIRGLVRGPGSSMKVLARPILMTAAGRKHFRDHIFGEAR